MRVRFFINTLVMWIVAYSFVCNAQSAAYSFLDIPTSSHVFALGGTNVTIIDSDITLAQQNPALIGPESDKNIALNYMHYLGSSNFASAAFGKGVGEHAAWGVGLRYLNYGSIEGMDISGIPTGSFSAQDVVFSGTFSYDITDRLRGGINVQFVYSSYEAYSAVALSSDLGINYFNEDKDLSLSLVLRNMGGQVKRFDRAYNRLPFDIVAGYMQGLFHSPFSLTITAHGLTKWNLPYYSHNLQTEETKQKSGFFPNLFRHLIFGIEYQPSEKFYAALAYNYKTRTDMSAYSRSFLSGFSIGVGLRLKSFGVGVSFAQPHKGGTSLMLNLSTDLNELLR